MPQLALEYLWPAGAEVRPWFGPIQDLSKRTMQRILLRNLRSTSTETGVTKEAQKALQNDKVSVTVQEWKHASRKDGPTKHFIIQAKSQDHFDDALTSHFTALGIHVRVWRGKLPQTIDQAPVSLE